MNFKELAENLGLEYDEYREIVKLFLETSASDLSKLQSANNEKNAQEVVEVAHSMKGAAGNMGFTEIFEVAKGMEMNARDNILEGTTEAIQILKNKLDEIAKNIRISE